MAWLAQGKGVAGIRRHVERNKEDNSRLDIGYLDYIFAKGRFRLVGRGLGSQAPPPYAPIHPTRTDINETRYVTRGVGSM